MQENSKSLQRRVGAVMKTLTRKIQRLEEPALEKLAEEESRDPFRVLVATMLSAQTRDTVTHAASTRLFDAAGNPSAMTRLTARRIERLIFPVSFYRQKARNVRATCHLLITRHRGQVPSTMQELLSLPGVGRKVANLVLILAFGSSDNICVDTHVHRISNRLGWVRTKVAEQTEMRLYEVVPRRWWASINLYLVTWGQNVCKPVYPHCDRCAISHLCPRVGVVRIAAGRQ